MANPAIDVVIRHNRIHDCTLGTWLDWQTQGTRVARNLFYANTRDLFVEVSHGPYVIDHNVLASRVAPLRVRLLMYVRMYNTYVCQTPRSTIAVWRSRAAVTSYSPARSSA